MSNEKLPRFVFSGELARKSQRIEGVLPVSKLKRVDGLLVDQVGDLAFCLDFGKNDEGYIVVCGTLSGQVHMRCQRCMESASIPLSSEISLACVESDREMESLPERYDPLPVINGRIDLYEMIEEEVLLSLPVVASHAEGECTLLYHSAEPDVPEEKAWPEVTRTADREKITENGPFSLLAHLKTNL